MSSQDWVDPFPDTNISYKCLELNPQPKNWYSTNKLNLDSILCLEYSTSWWHNKIIIIYQAQNHWDLNINYCTREILPEHTLQFCSRYDYLFVYEIIVLALVIAWNGSIYFLLFTFVSLIMHLTLQQCISFQLMHVCNLLWLLKKYIHVININK